MGKSVKIIANINYIPIYITELSREEYGENLWECKLYSSIYHINWKEGKNKKNHCEYKFHQMDRVVPSPLHLHLEGSLLFDSLLVSPSPTTVLDAWLFLRVRNLNPTRLCKKYTKNLWECKLYSSIYHRNWKEGK